jgi:hypothetical protein
MRELNDLLEEKKQMRGAEYVKESVVLISS